MPRQARFVEPKLPYHVTQRGNYRQDVFSSDDDYEKYLDLLQRYSNKYRLEIWAYCLMSNHVHLIVYPLEQDSMSRTLATSHMVYSHYFNRRLGLVGHLWQGRFYSCALDKEHLGRAVRYVEMNPVRAKLVSSPEEWEWSSAGHHLGLKSDPLLRGAQWPDKELLSDWKSILGHDDTEFALEKLRHSTRTGRPLGSKIWIKELENRSGRRLHALPKGRPKGK